MRGAGGSGRLSWLLDGTTAVAITALCLLQTPGRIVPETKLDLVVDPGAFLGRALHLWDPSAAFGQVQNQAAGYLLPMGPFFLLGHALGIPPWIVQRGWWALLLVVATIGARRLIGALGIGTPSSRRVGGLAYALAPPMVGLVGFQSGGQLPYAMLPWVLLPLVVGAREGSPRRAAARSALAVALTGAVNGAASAVVLLAPALWLVTRSRSPRRAALTRWWLGCVAAAVAWWAVPLALQARYGLDFTAYTETSAVTTSSTSLTEVLRGTGNWLGFLSVDGTAWLPGAWVLASSPLAIIGSVAVAAAGLAALARRDMPERRFLVLALLLGVVGLSAAYAGAAGGPLSGPARELLDGPGAAFRNVYKLEPLVRLPLAAGLAHVLAVRARIPIPKRAAPAARALDGLLALSLALVFIVAGALPIVRGQLPAEGSFDEIPGYWRATAAWLRENGHGSRALLIPSAPFGEYRWGRPLDEPLQALSAGQWAVRDLIPLGSEGEARLLDEVERVLDEGRLSSPLAAFLARAGVGHLVVRNDLDRSRVSASSPLHIRRVLAATPGLRLVERFGPVVGASVTSERLPPEAAPVDALRAVEVYAVEGGAETVSTAPRDALSVVSGGPESLLSLLDAGVVDDEPVVLAGDATAAGILTGRERWIATDGLRRRDVAFGQVRDNLSYTLARTAVAPDTGDPPVDRLPTPGVEHQTVAVPAGDARVISASSYAAGRERLPETKPSAAFDGDTATAWVPAAVGGTFVGAWLQLDLEDAVTAGSVAIRTPPASATRASIAAVEVSTAAGAVTGVIRPGSVTDLALPPGATQWVRITIGSITGAGYGVDGPGITEVALDGVDAREAIDLPDDMPAAIRARADGPTAIVLRTLRADPYDRTRRDEEPVLHRVVHVPDTAAFRVAGTAVASPGPELDALVERLAADRASMLDASASSVWRDLPAFAARRAVDDDPSTAWVSEPGDPLPTLRLSWVKPRAVGQLSLSLASVPARRPTTVEIRSEESSQTVELSPEGTASFDSVTTRSLSLSFPPVPSTPGESSRSPVAVAELGVEGIHDLRVNELDRGAPLDLGCESGPPLRIDGTIVHTRVRGTLADLVELRPLGLDACLPESDQTLGEGTHTIDAEAGGAFAITSLRLTSLQDPIEPPAPREATVTAWGTVARTVHLAAGAATVLEVNENANDGWTASLGGQRLQSVRLDGWRQGWLVPAGAAGDVQLSYAPDRVYRVGLLLGAVLLAFVLALAVAPGRRAGVGLAPSAPGVPAAWLGVALATAAVALVAGPLAIAVPLLVLMRGRAGALPLTAAGAFVVSGTLALLDPGSLPGDDTGAFGAPAQILAGLAFAAVGASLAPDIVRAVRGRRS